ncbi:MAG: copper resistance protein CopC [Gammaproteobacteria bacterium HGW-Gammaproteobacteria-10]|nr:MAG: copper resistance protein CopC [Gammaproteobacteria bacterium HGW-Gammaproteobacteria-10]
MFKKFIQTFIVLLTLNCGTVFAHAVVTQTSLKIDPIQSGKDSQVSLFFNSRVELALSHFDLVKKGDIHERLAVKQGGKRGEVIVSIPPLEPGEHAIRLKVFAADGHLTEDIIRFYVTE